MSPTELFPRSGCVELLPGLIAIPAGAFLMGCNSGQDCEQPVHRVWIDEFLLAPFQVTNTEYGRFLNETDAVPPPFWHDSNFADPEQPVVGVSWFDAAQYCKWLAERTGRRFRLPSEAEWERAARGCREAALFPWGDSPPESLPGYAERWKTGPEPVGRGEVNGFGLFNMCDNVHEWCSDWFNPEYYAVSPSRNPRGPETGLRRSSRGGSWRHHIKIARCAARSSIPPDFKYADYGFRVACDAEIAGP